LCNPENLFVEGISSIEKLFSNVDLLEKMSKNARKYSEKRLSRERCLNNFKHFFNEEYSKIDNDLSKP
jgi:glycosyltransferase involved in cell wall biosynthesis